MREREPIFDGESLEASLATHVRGRAVTAAREQREGRVPQLPLWGPLLLGASFVAVGVALVYAGWGRPGRPVDGVDQTAGLPVALAGIVFAVFGAAALVFVRSLLLGRKVGRTRRLWAQRREWISGRIPASEEAVTSTILVAIGAFLFTGLFVGTMVVAGGEDRSWLLALIFPVAATVPLFRAIRARANWLRFAPATLDLKSLPVVPGRTSYGFASIRCRLEPEHEVTATLTCIQKMKKLGRTYRDSPVWRSEVLADDRRIEFDGVDTRVPIAIELPIAVPESQIGSFDWELNVRIRGAGLGYTANFEVPVFSNDVFPDD